MAMINGEDTEEPTLAEKVEREDIGNSQGKKYCGGTHAWLSLDEFKLDTSCRYCDHYLKSKGLWVVFGGVLDAEGEPVYDVEGNPVRAQEVVEEEPDFAKTPEPDNSALVAAESTGDFNHDL